MGRIRTIKPDFPQSESMGKVSREARLCFIMLWTVADDEGRLRGSPRMLASLLYPYDEDSTNDLRMLVESWLHELQDQGCINWYESDGSQYIEICKWLNHQKIDRPSKSKIPPFNEDSTRIRRKIVDGSTTEGNGRDKDKDKERIKPPYPLCDSLSQIAEIEKPNNQKQRKPKNETIDPDPPPELPIWLPFDDWQRFIEMRKTMKKPMTNYAQRLQLEKLEKFRKFGHDPAEILRSSITNGWQSLYAPKLHNHATAGGIRRPAGISEQDMREFIGDPNYRRPPDDEVHEAWLNEGKVIDHE